MFFDMPPPPPNLTPLKVEEKVCTAILKNSFLSFITIPTTPPPEKYSDLPCTKEDTDKIIELISTIGSHGKIELLLHHKKRCRQIEAEIRHIHPFKFLSVIFSRPEMTKYMKHVHDDWFVWKNFIDGLSGNMKNEATKRRIYPFLSEFAKEVNAPEYELKVYIDRKDYEGLLKYLIYR